jgi:hypothetical protein
VLASASHGATTLNNAKQVTPNGGDTDQLGDLVLRTARKVEAHVTDPDAHRE